MTDGAIPPPEQAARYSPGQAVRDWAARNPQHVAIVGDAASLTFAEWDRRADRLSAALAGCGIGPGDRVMYVGRNRAAHPVAMVAVSRLRAVTVAVNWRLGVSELAHIVEDSQPRVVLAEREFEQGFCGALDRTGLHPEIVWLDGAAGLEQLAAWNPGMSSQVMPGIPRGDDVAALIYTSGTTGAAKGVVITNAQLGAVVSRNVPWRLSEESVFLLALPVFHVSGMGLSLTISYLGGTVVMLADADPARVASAICEHRVTDTMLVPALIQLVIDDPQASPDQFATLRSLSYGAAPMPRPLLERTARYFAGVELAQGYGLSESVGPITYLTAEDHRAGGRILASAGRPIDGVEVKTADPMSGHDVGAGEIGEVWTRSNQNSSGYLNRPAETSQLFADGWLRTGDLGYVEDGYVYLVDRMKDLIVTGGENVYASEVEACLVRIPGVAEACVIGIPDPRWGEAVVAAVVPRPGAAIEPGQIIAAARTELAHYKCPAAVHLVDSLPRNTTGKVLRRDIRALLTATDARQG